MARNARQTLDRYLEGWRLGDPKISMAVLCPDFHYDDPNTGRIDRDGFADFMEAFKADAAALNGGQLGTPFLTYSDVVVDETSTPHTTWCWWRAAGTEFQGAALIHFDHAGIRSERIAYFSALPG